MHSDHRWYSVFQVSSITFDAIELTSKAKKPRNCSIADRASRIHLSLVSHRSRGSMSIENKCTKLSVYHSTRSSCTAIDERPCWKATDAKVISKHETSVRRNVASMATSSNFHIWNIDAWHWANNRWQSFSDLSSSSRIPEEMYTCCDRPSMKRLWNEERATPDDWQPVVQLCLLR